MISLELSTALPKALPKTDIPAIAQAMTKALRIRRSIEIGVRFVSLDEIQTLNRTFRKKNKPTDVLSFSAEEDAHQPRNMPLYWGDLAICTAYAKEEARRRSISLQEELTRLLVHGILHLAGYDHATDEEELAMFAIQERVVESLV